MTERYSATDTAKAMRAALSKAFPGSRLSLTCNRGTGYGYMTLSWVDGPTSFDVDWVLSSFLSERLSDRPDDSVTRIDNRWTCKGVHNQRTYSERALAAARQVIEDPGEYDANLYRYLDHLDLRES